MKKKKKKILHLPVLLKESIKYLNIKKNGIYLDATFGSGGHSRKILQKLGKLGKLYAMDRDPESIKIAKKIKDKRFKIIYDKFSNIKKYLKKYQLKNNINGILIDLGISNLQLKNKNRGFSYQKNGFLDMRMDTTKGISAAKWIKKSNIKTISKILKKYGEEKFSYKIALNIHRYKKKKDILTTKKLYSIIKKSVPSQKKNPARRSFQAIRICINNEIKELKKFLIFSKNLLSKNSRLLTISFHSLEDRIIKNFIFKNSKKNINIPNKLPLTAKQILKTQSLKNFKFYKKKFPSSDEITKNRQSRSAILRVSKFLKK
ncbi:16S rRNA (cytosine(1402)-N(4))-methyltransferase RsmH [Buchnera aphidicola]|uniref:16S rRNA (cytosine(1402)-N(4))-methyltransferase RsmH n=1 Tax=Buchnera aphidicola TaxID=9 RepID=UPI0030EEF8A2